MTTKKPPVLTDEDIDALRIKAFQTNLADDRKAYFEATSRYFQDRHYRAMDREQAVLKRAGADAVRAALAPSPKCLTCGGHGMIGGFCGGDSGYQSDPCPDCAAPSPGIDAAGQKPIPFRLGNEYQTQAGEWVRFVSVHNEGTSYETMADEAGRHRYTNRDGDLGRLTATAHDYSDPGNTPPLYAAPPAAQPSAEQQPVAWLQQNIDRPVWFEIAAPNEKALTKDWTDGFPVFRQSADAQPSADDPQFPFYELRFIMRVLSHQGSAPKEDWQTAYGMARDIFVRWAKDRAAEPHPPNRACMCDECKPSFENGADDPAQRHDIVRQVPRPSAEWLAEAERLVDDYAKEFAQGGATYARDIRRAALLAHLRTKPSTEQWCDTMDRPKSKCGCPDCGPSLIDLGPGLRNTPGKP